MSSVTAKTVPADNGGPILNNWPSTVVLPDRPAPANLDVVFTLAGTSGAEGFGYGEARAVTINTSLGYIVSFHWLLRLQLPARGALVSRHDKRLGLLLRPLGLLRALAVLRVLG